MALEGPGIEMQEVAASFFRPRIKGKPVRKEKEVMRCRESPTTILPIDWWAPLLPAGVKGSWR
jgi:hypothetical protein